MSFFSELRRRNVFRVTAAYLALSWVVIEVTGAVVPALHLPPSIPSVVVWLAVIGFPIILIFSWAYELTPEGLKRESEVDRAASIIHLTGRRLDYVTIAMLATAMLLLAMQHFWPTPGEVPARSTTVESSVQAPQSSALGATTSLSAHDKSIAVLPFSDMSQAKDQEFMSDGIAEELLNLLAKVPELKVIARTSSFAFKGKDVKIQQIAEELHVAHVVEGSVRRSGDKLRITAQLIRTADSTHLWSETYDRQLDDIFVVQDEIAGAIVQALQIQLMGGTLARQKGGTQNLDAYQLYLRATSALYENTRSSLEVASDNLGQAIKLDPNYGFALMRLAHVTIAQTDNGFLIPTEGYERARELARHALQVSPNLADAHTVLQYIYQTLDWDWAAAEAEGRRALAIDPTNPLALNAAGKLAATLGRWDLAEQQLRAALVRNPLDTYAIYNLGSAYYLAGRYAESEVVYRQLLELAPNFAWTWYGLGKTLLAVGKPEAAIAMVLQDVDEGSQLFSLPIVLQAVGRKGEADDALQAQIAYWSDTGAYCIAMTYAYRGDHDLALEWLERAYKQKDATLVEIVGEPLFSNLADDPRFNAFLRKMKLPEWESHANEPGSP